MSANDVTQLACVIANDVTQLAYVTQLACVMLLQCSTMHIMCTCVYKHKYETDICTILHT